MSLINIEKTIALDVYDHNTTPSVIKAIQLDTGTRNVSAVIQNSGQAYDIGQNAAVSLTVLRPDKTKVQITGQTFSYTGYGSDATAYGAKADLSDVALAIKGNLKAQFKITSGAQELRTEIFTINNGEALDAGDGDWAGDLDGHNLDEMAQDISETKAAVAEMESDISDLKEGFNNLKDCFVEDRGEGEVVTLTNELNADDMYSNQANILYALKNNSFENGVATIGSANSTEQNPFYNVACSKGVGNWLVGFKYRLTKIDPNLVNPSNMAIFLGSQKTNYGVNWGEWIRYSDTLSGDLSRLRLAVYGFTNGLTADQFTIEIKDVYVYEVSDVSSEMLAYIQTQQNSNYRDGTATYGEATVVSFTPDDTLTEAGKVADAKATGDAIRVCEIAIGGMTESISEATSDVDALGNSFVINESKEATLSNTVSVTNIENKDGFDSGSVTDGVLTFGIRSGNTEKNPYAINTLNFGSGKWLVGFKYKLIKIDSSLGDPSYLHFILGSGTVQDDSIVYDEWVVFNKIFEGDLTRVYFSIKNFATAPQAGQLQFIVKDYYVYNVADIDDDMLAYVMSQQIADYKDGTVVYKIPKTYTPDTTLSQSGKAADASVVGNAINALNGKIENSAVETETVDFSFNYYIDNSGVTHSSSSSATTDFIPLDDAKAISYTGKMGSFKVAHWYGDNQEYISSTISPNETMQWYINVLRTKPDGAKYVRLTSKKLTAENPPAATPEVVVYYGKNYDQYLINAIVGDGVTDDTLALQRAVNLCDDVTLESKQKILISSPIIINPMFSKSINGNGAKIIVDDDFYAFSVSGSLASSSNPNNVAADVMELEAATVISGLRITSVDGVSGGGIEATKAFKLCITDNYIYKCNNGIRLYGKCRDITIAQNHVYAVQNDGVLFDSGIDLHQCNVVNNMIQYAMICLHIYNPYAIANFQIDSNDIEISTYPTGYENAIALMFEGASSAQFSEIEICGNTIQGHATSNDVMRLIGGTSIPICEVSIVGNHIGNSSARAIWLENCMNIAIASNTYKDINTYLYEMHGNCSQIVIIGDVARRVYRGRIYAASDAVLDRIVCQHVICTSAGSDKIDTENVTNMDIT